MKLFGRHPVTLDGQPIRRVSFVADTIGRIGEHQIGFFSVHQSRDIVGLGRIAAQQPVTA